MKIGCSPKSVKRSDTGVAKGLAECRSVLHSWLASVVHPWPEVHRPIRAWMDTSGCALSLYPIISVPVIGSPTIAVSLMSRYPETSGHREMVSGFFTVQPHFSSHCWAVNPSTGGFVGSNIVGCVLAVAVSALGGGGVLAMNKSEVGFGLIVGLTTATLLSINTRASSSKRNPPSGITIAAIMYPPAVLKVTVEWNVWV